jgi:aldose 1-epimerase
MAEIFGKTATGETVERFVIRGGGLTANILSFGAIIQDLRLDGHDLPLVLGFERFEDYPKHSPYFGATPGRLANRVAKGRCVIDGMQVELERNEDGISHLHGGKDGIAWRNWTLVEHADDHVRLSIVDPDGRAGYPGNCTITVDYRVMPGGTLNVRYESSADRPTLANVCQHSYFNLDGSADILGHEIMIKADHYLPVDGDTIPTGEIAPVDGTPFDLRRPRAVGLGRVGAVQLPYDHNFCLSRERTAKRHVARVRSPMSGVTLDVSTTEPGIQFYAGSKIDVEVPGLTGEPYAAYAGLCLETQIWPDAINHPDFPNAVLRPGETLVQETDYVFSR